MLSLDRFDPDARKPVQFIDDPELQYTMLRYRQTHDFLHVLLDLPASVVGELALKWVEMSQTGLPMCAFSCAFAPIRLDSSTALQLCVLPSSATLSYTALVHTCSLHVGTSSPFTLINPRTIKILTRHGWMFVFFVWVFVCCPAQLTASTTGKC